MKIYRYFNILSLDVVFGACINSWLISKILSLHIPISSIFGLATCVWLIYTADHLLDAYQIKHVAGTRRHCFHQKFFSHLSTCFIVISICGLINFWFLPPNTQFWGILIALVVVAYLILIAGLKLKIGNIKEVLVAVTYTSSVFMVPLSLYTGSWHLQLFMAFIQLFFLAFLNLIIFSLIDFSVDDRDGHKSLVRTLGKKLSFKVIHCSFLFLIASFAIAFIYFEANLIFYYAELIYLTMALVLFFIYWKRNKLNNNEHYRLLGDLVFLLPLLLFFL